LFFSQKTTAIRVVVEVSAGVEKLERPDVLIVVGKIFGIFSEQVSPNQSAVQLQRNPFESGKTVWLKKTNIKTKKPSCFHN